MGRAEIDEIVIAEVDDPDAWEEPIWVPPSKAPRPLWAHRARHLELAARFHVLSILHRLGAEATLTFSHPDDVDITVVRKSGDALTVDVKTLIGSNPWAVEQLTARKHHFVVFVQYSPALDDPGAAPSVYVVASESLQKYLRRHHHGRQMSLSSLSDYLNAWEPLTSQTAA